MLPSSLKTTIFGLTVLLFYAAPAVAQIAGIPHELEYFGDAVATGDFNNDGYTDLAVGVWADNLGGIRPGAVNVIYGTSGGLDVPDNTLWLQGAGGIEGVSEENDLFGYSLAVGDFNGDNYDDLAIGVPREDVGAIVNAGAVHVLYGSAGGLQAASNQLWEQGDLLPGSDEPSDQWGWALAAGDFDNDGFDDLAVGSPFKDIVGLIDVGAVHVIHGASTGLDAAGVQVWYQAFTGTGTSDVQDEFGYSLAAGNFDGDNYDDLAIGIPHEDAGGAVSAGGVTVLYGTNTGLSAAGSQLWSQASAGILGTPEPQDQLGSALTTGDFDNDGFDDLAIGAELEDVGTVENAGAVNVIYGTAAGLSETGNQYFDGSAPDIPITPETNDRFGSSLAAGDFDNDNDDDLVIGIPTWDVGAAVNAGAILVIAGTPGGLDPSEAALLFTQNDAEVEGDAGPHDRFGWALAAGDFDANGTVDIAVGVRGETVDGEGTAGAVNALYGVFGGLDSSQLLFQGATLVANEPEAPGLPTTFALLPAYPNPFNPSTTLRYDVPQAGPVRITVFDALGREVALLVNEEHTAGHHTIAFDAQGLPSGLYLVRMEAGGAVQAQRVTLLR